MKEELTMASTVQEMLFPVRSQNFKNIETSSAQVLNCNIECRQHRRECLLQFTGVGVPDFD